MTEEKQGREPTPEEVKANVKRAEAEARKFDAEAEAALIKAKADAKASTAQAALSGVELEMEQARLVSVLYDKDRAEEKRKKELAAHEYYHIYPFNGSVTEASTQKCMDQLMTWDRNDPGCDIEIMFHSGGGSVVDGLALWDTIKLVQASGHKVITSSVGMAASMAGILLMGGDTRIMGKEAWLMIHEASFGAQGKMGDVEDTVKWVQMVQDRILDIFAAGCARASSETATKRLSRTQLKNRWRRQNWWISSTDALAYGLVDELR